MRILFVKFQDWLNKLYIQEGWNNYHAFTDSNFILEELGEVSEIVEQINALSTMTEDQEKNILKHYTQELMVKMKEEVGDLFSALIAVTSRFHMNISNVFDILETKKISVIDNTEKISDLRLVVKIANHLGSLAKEIRRQEIGRHSHKEDLSKDEMDIKMTFAIAMSLMYVIRLSNYYDLSLKEIIDQHKNKMNSKYLNND
jgi:NTP pyrophosphatase (non-canonical NTP hydrolase)